MPYLYASSFWSPQLLSLISVCIYFLYRHSLWVTFFFFLWHFYPLLYFHYCCCQFYMYLCKYGQLSENYLTSFGHPCISIKRIWKEYFLLLDSFWVSPSKSACLKFIFTTNTHKKTWTVWRDYCLQSANKCPDVNNHRIGSDKLQS